MKQEVRSQEPAPAGLPSNVSIGGIKRGSEVRRRNTLFCILYSVFCILIFTGCSIKQNTLSPHLRSDGANTSFNIAKIKPISAFKGTGSLKITSGKFLHTTSIALAAKSPDFFRLEFLNPLNQPSAVIANNEHGYQLYYSGRFYKGAHLPSAFPLQDLQDVPLYLIGWSDIPHEKITGMESDDGLNAVIISLDYDNRVSHKVWVNSKDYTIMKREVYDRDSSNILAMVFSDYTEINSAKFPMLVQIKNGSLDINIRYTRVQVNGDMDNEIFSLAEVE